MAAIVLDTDVASLIIKDRLPETVAAQLTGHELCITFVTYGELTQWVRLRLWGTQRQVRLREWLLDRPLIHGDMDVATVWGEISAQAIQDGRPQPTNDSWIAACCLTYDLPLATFNVKDYTYFAERHGLRLFIA